MENRRGTKGADEIKTTDEARSRHTVWLHNKVLIYTEPHTHASILIMRKVQVTAESGLFTLHPPDRHLISPHTNTHNKDTLITMFDVVRYTQNTAQQAVCSERWMNTPICTKENTMFCDDNKHSYTSAFFIPKWLRHAMDFINGTLHSFSHTAHCNHYSNTRIASIIKHMHGWKRIWISFTHHSRVPKRNTWMSLTVLCLQSLSRDHNGFQLSKDYRPVKP